MHGSKQSMENEMIDKLKTSAAVLALIAAPSFASADSLAVSLSATFGNQDVFIDATGGDANCDSGGTTGCVADGGDGGDVAGDVTSGGELDVANQTVTVAAPTAISVAAATGANAAASTAAVTVEGTADATFANAGGGNVAVSEQEGSFTNDTYTSQITFGSVPN